MNCAAEFLSFSAIKQSRRKVTLLVLVSFVYIYETKCMFKQRIDLKMHDKAACVAVFNVNVSFVFFFS